MTDHDPYYDKVLDIIEHPERYSKEELSRLLSVPEVREIYELLCMTDSSIEANELNMDVDAEWDTFARNHPVRKRGVFPWFGNRAASIAAIVGASIVAVAAGIAVSVVVSDHKSTSPSDKEIKIENASFVATTDDSTVVGDSIRMSSSPIMFENQSLETIMDAISKIYSVEVIFNNKETARLHLYYRLNPALSIDEVVSQLNTFEQLNLRFNDNVITID